VGLQSPQYTCVSHRLPVVSVDIHTVHEDTRKHVEIGKGICLKWTNILATSIDIDE
jgi:hypothetical protein